MVEQFQPSMKRMAEVLENSSIYRIPPYQRKYTWNKDQWENIISDLDNFEEDSHDKTHFIGTFVFVDPSDREPNVYKVVDGQQRLTTISLFYLALYRRASEYLNDYRHLNHRNLTENHDYFTETHSSTEDILKLIFKSDNRGKLDKQHLKPILILSDVSNNNNNYINLCDSNYKYVKNLERPDDGHKDDSISWEEIVVCDQRSLIYRGYQYFYNELSNIINDEIFLPENPSPIDLTDFYKKAIDRLLIYSNNLSKYWKGIIINVSYESDACLLFDSLNNRGVSLSPIDIVKNNLFHGLLGRDDDAKLSKDQEGILDEAQDEWAKLTERLESENILRKFFVDFYNIRYVLNNSVKKKKFINESSVIKEYDGLCNNLGDSSSAKNLYDDLISDSIIYQAIVCPSKKSTKDRLYYYPLLMLKGISGKPAYGLLMYLFKTLNLDNSNPADKDIKIFKDIVMYLNCFFTLRHILDFPKVKYLPKLFELILNDCKKITLKKSKDVIDIFSKYLTSEEYDKYCCINKLDLLKEEICKLTYDDQSSRKAVIKFLFTLYDQKDTTYKESAVYETYWSPDIKEGCYTIEHILPQGGRFKNTVDEVAWSEMIGPENMRNRDTYTHKIGNLILCDLNLEVGQKCFTDKKEIYSECKQFLSINELQSYDAWNFKIIDDRSSDLATKFTYLLLEKLKLGQKH